MRARSLRAPWLLAAVLLGVGFPLVVAFVTGGIRIAHNDDWAYTRIAQTFGETGHIGLVGWNRMFLVGQVVVLGPLARSIVAQHLFVAATGVVALSATYVLLRPRLGPRRAVLAAAVLAAWPGFGLLTTSFMTDVPSYAAMVSALALGDAAVRRRSRRLLGAALVVGLWGTTIREQGVAALVAVSVAALAGWGRRRDVLLLVVPAAAAALALEAWRRSLPYGDSPGFHPAGIHGVGGWAAHSYFTLAAPLLPLTLLVRPATWRRRSWAVAAIVGAGGAMLALRGPDAFFTGNYLTPYVAYREASVGEPRVVPGPVWGIVLAAAVVSGALLAGAVVERLRRLDLLLAAFTFSSFLFVAGEFAVGQSFFDRDLLVFVPACAIVCAAGGHAVPRPRSYLALAAVAGLGSVTLIATLAYDEARWHAAEQVATSPTNVDAGLEWMGMHAALPAHRQRPGDQGFESMFPGSPSCYVITGPTAPHPGPVLRTYSYSWLFGRERLFVSRRC